jgi:hypothetical protein
VPDEPSCPVCREPIEPANGVVFLWGTMVHLHCADRELPPREPEKAPEPIEPRPEDRPEGESVA